MKKMLRAMTLMGALFVLGCTNPISEIGIVVTKPLSSQDLAMKDRALTGGSFNSSSAEVTRLGDGLWIYQNASSRYQPAGYAFWVDIKVKNLDSQKSVGIKWTTDNWTTTNTASASFEADLGSGFERWGVDVKLPIQYPYSTTNIEYALFANQGGITTWDPMNNYFIGGMGNANVKFLGGKTVSNSGSVAFEGLVRVKNLAYEKKVTAVYTTNNWSTTQTVSAQYNSGNDWIFSIPLTLPNPLDLEVAVSYQVNGQTYWDNNESKNHKFPIGPHLTKNDGLTGDWLAGQELIVLYDNNVNPLASVSATVNNRIVEVQTINGIKTLVNTPEFAPATNLVVTFTAKDSFGFIQKKSYNFKATYNLVPQGVFGTTDFQWPYNMKAKNNQLFVADHGKSQVGIYNPSTGVNDLHPTVAQAQDVDQDSFGRTVVLASFYTPRVDFYQNGQSVKSFPIPSSTLNIPVAMEIENDVLYIGSYVDNKILKMDLDGNVLGSIPLEWFQKYKIVGDKIYLVTTYPETKILILNLDGSLVKEIPLSGPAYSEISYPEDIAVGEGFIALIQSYKLLVLNIEGELLGKWTGRDFDYVDNSNLTIPGRFGSVISSVEAIGKDIYVGDFGAHTIHKFTFQM